MSLSCSCDFDSGCDWYWEPAKDFSILRTKRGRKCCSCGDKIQVGATVCEIYRARPAHCDYEVRRFGDEYDAIELASAYLCERCAGLFFSLRDLGFSCVSPYENMIELVKEYAETYQRKQDKSPDNPPTAACG